MVVRIESRAWSSNTLLRGLSLVHNGKMDVGAIHGMADEDLPAMEEELKRLEAVCSSLVPEKPKQCNP